MEAIGAVLAVAWYMFFHVRRVTKKPELADEGHPSLIPAMVVLGSSYSFFLCLKFAGEAAFAKFNIAGFQQPILQPDLQLLGVLAGGWLAGEAVLVNFGIDRPGMTVVRPRKRLAKSKKKLPPPDAKKLP